jgi:hypothetical protein
MSDLSDVPVELDYVAEVGKVGVESDTVVTLPRNGINCEKILPSQHLQ